MMTHCLNMFKINPSIDGWNKVKEVTPENDWYTLKNDLIKDIVNNPDISLRLKIPFLLDNEFYAEAISAIPKLTLLSWELDLLKQVWDTIDRDKPALRESLFPHVRRYVKKYFDEKRNLKALHPLLSSVLKTYPDKVVEFYQFTIHYMLSSLKKEQYYDFVNEMQVVKDVLGESVWPDIMGFLRRQTTKSLIQLLSMVDNDTWKDHLTQRKTKLRSNSNTMRKKRKLKDEEDNIIVSDTSPTTEDSERKGPYNLRKRPRRTTLSPYFVGNRQNTKPQGNKQNTKPQESKTEKINIEKEEKIDTNYAPSDDEDDDEEDSIEESEDYMED
eukprot:TRINITY_DN1427_c0_g1_i1.p1 TRINITY_DN1427_c0_g1~~TRINITY_DN1427_c0_g1_i1.p1  ORF type:complete len:328 (+),score=61.17 TRINITY_DN1427_c0_g1_i1:139-1122(+)